MMDGAEPCPKRMARRGGFCTVTITLLLLVLPASAQENTAAEADQLDKQVVELYQQGKYAEAVPLALKAVEIHKRVLGEDHPAYATSLNNLALVYKAQGKFAEAESLYQRSLAIREKALAPDHPDVATSLNNLAGLYADQGKYAAAEPLYQRSLAIREKALGPDHPDVATSLSNLALLYKKQGKYAAAEPLYQRSLAIREKALGPDHPALATSLNNLAFLYMEQGKYAAAEPLYQRSLAILEKALGPDHPAVAQSLNNLAALYKEQGRYAQAEPLYQRSLAIREKTLGPDHADVAAGLNNLALVYKAQGKYAEAEPLYKRALAIDERALGPQHPWLATHLNNLAALYEAQGKYAEAEPLYQRSLAIREKTLGPDHPDLATSLNNLAVLYQAQGKYAEAEPLYQRSLAIREKALGPDHPDVATSLNSLAALYYAQGKYAEAEPLYQRSLAIREKALGPDHPHVAQSLNNLAALYHEVGKYAEAEPLYKRSLAIREKALGPDHPLVATTVENLAALYYAQALPLQAAPFYDRSLAVLGKQFDYHFTYMSEKERLEFLHAVYFSFPMYFSFCLSFRGQLPELVSKMYDLVLWEKGFIAQSVAALRAKIQASGDADALRLLDRLTEKKNQLARLARAPAESDPQKQVARRAQVEQLDKETNELEKELVARSGALGEEKRLARVSWRQVRDALKPEEAAVEIVRFPFHDGKKWTDKSYYVGLVLRHKSAQPAYIVLGEAKDLESTVLDQYRRGAALARGFAVTEEASEVSAAARSAFYNAFWKPLEPALAGAHRIYFAPDGVLNQLALGVVPDAEGRLLLERYELRILNSTKDLLEERSPANNKDAILVGNPRFLLSADQQRAALRQLRQGSEKATILLAPATTLAGPSGVRPRDLWPVGGRCNPAPPPGGTICPLPGTAAEIASVSEMLKRSQWQVSTYQDETALEEVVKAVRHPRVLHVATHGFFLADQKSTLGSGMINEEEGRPTRMEDPMLRSGLLLAGAERAFRGEAASNDLDDGVLTAYEASTLDLQGTELVVLSACETGLGEQQEGEGVFGLRRAFQEAGAEAVLMSMWSVPDRETQELMALFYGKWLAGMDKHEALRQAQLEERETVRKRYGKDLPYYWGAFVLVGR